MHKVYNLPYLKQILQNLLHSKVCIYKHRTRQSSEIDSVKNDIFANDVPAKVDECTNLLKAEYEKEIDELGTSFKSLNEQYENATKELEKYKAKESLEKANQHKADVDALFERYASKLGKCAEFLVYKAKTKPEDVTLEEVSEKLKYMYQVLHKHSFHQQLNRLYLQLHHSAHITGDSTNEYGYAIDTRNVKYTIEVQ